ncbi:hypothetical protein [Glaciihabitans arcticus]|nr:hypothetical protein [Glaciihabitans arcticus]
MADSETEKPDPEKAPPVRPIRGGNVAYFTPLHESANVIKLVRQSDEDD